MKIHKNKKCFGCEYYSLRGSRKCLGVIQKYYEDFKQVCPCRNCNQKETCLIKTLYIIKTEFPNIRLFQNTYPCCTYLFTSKEFIESIDDYYKNTSYRDPQYNDRYIVIKRNLASAFLEAKKSSY